MTTCPQYIYIPPHYPPHAPRSFSHSVPPPPCLPPSLPPASSQASRAAVWCGLRSLIGQPFGKTQRRVSREVISRTSMPPDAGGRQTRAAYWARRPVPRGPGPGRIDFPTITHPPSRATAANSRLIWLCIHETVTLGETAASPCPPRRLVTPRPKIREPRP